MTENKSDKIKEKKRQIIDRLNKYGSFLLSSFIEDELSYRAVHEMDGNEITVANGHIHHNPPTAPYMDVNSAFGQLGFGRITRIEDAKENVLKQLN